jgi:hypothetical protein
MVGVRRMTTVYRSIKALRCAGRRELRQLIGLDLRA